ncbi:helix-turn-helix domain-containing protein [Aquabacterium sp.]|uniref:helix-turn-helix transcriptional regulator n=1 Tax=Aquabacterium sp. TaxID=1872578 RepID=UPI0026356E4D|nr:helix-turn-helix domain-containing protein [Aquabacterium sp.]
MRPDNTLTPAEAQAFLGVPHATFYRMKRKGELPKPCAWMGRTPLYSCAEIEAVKVLRAGSKAPASVDAVLSRAHDSAVLAVALLVQTQTHLDAVEATVGDLPEAAAWWMDPTNAEHTQLLLEPVVTLGLALAVLQRLVEVDIPAQCAKTLEEENDKA